MPVGRAGEGRGRGEWPKGERRERDKGKESGGAGRTGGPKREWLERGKRKRKALQWRVASCELTD